MAADLIPVRLTTDDDIRNFRRVWLGPNGQSLPWQASFKAYGVFAGLMIVSMWVAIAIFQNPFSATLAVNVGSVCALACWGIMRLTDSETPLRALPGMAVAGARAGRTADPTSSHKADTSRLRVIPDPWEKAVQDRATRRPA